MPVGVRTYRGHQAELKHDSAAADTEVDRDMLGADVPEHSERGEKIQYECAVEMSNGEGEGPVFSVTPMSADGQLLVERRRQVCICFICVPYVDEGRALRCAGSCG